MSESTRKCTADVDLRDGQSNEHGHNCDEIGKKEELNLEALGPMTWAERVILADFALLVLIFVCVKCVSDDPATFLFLGSPLS